ncbi:MAG: glutamate racemase [Bacteroidetes bacterium]|nr:MAG: glutamate racemase [Bacteroidota bacterium]PTM12085.1 MAG: glutamate racemase [Bacteroidota bacterium]
MQAGNNHPIGVFDSGIGGLSVANAIFSLLPHESIVYFADTGRVPYGPRPKAEIRRFAHEIAAFLIGQGCKLLVVACNTVTAVALEDLRQQWPDIPIVGMEPAVKPAAAATRNNKVGVLATQVTITSERFAQLMDRYTVGVHVWANPCLGLVPLIEAGKMDDPETEALLHEIVDPMLAEGVDTLVLGCTHYPFIQPLLRRMVGSEVEIIDPSPAVARQVKRRLEALHLAAHPDHVPDYRFFASGATTDLALLTPIPFFIDAITG